MGAVIKICASNDELPPLPLPWRKLCTYCLCRFWLLLMMVLRTAGRSSSSSSLSPQSSAAECPDKVFANDSAGRIVKTGVNANFGVHTHAPNTPGAGNFSPGRFHLHFSADAANGGRCCQNKNPNYECVIIVDADPGVSGPMGRPMRGDLPGHPVCRGAYTQQDDIGTVR
jgi:hypothetical protein